MKIVLKNTIGESLSIDVKPEETFLDLKKRIWDQNGINLDLQKINLNGKKITDDQVVSEYFVEAPSEAEPVEYEAEENIIAMLCCAIPGCNTNQTSIPERSFFPFPKDDERCKQWLVICQRVDLLDKSSVEIHENYTVCSDHFVPEQFADSSRNCLLELAIPTILPLECSNLNQTTEGIHTSVIKNEFCNANIKDEPRVSIESDEFISESDDNGDEEELENDEELSDDDDDEVEYDDNDGEDLPDELEHPGQLCRLCAKNIADMLYIFGSDGKEQHLAEKINTCLPVTVRSTDPLPKQLCVDCIMKLDFCHEFAKSCIQAEERLRQLHKRKCFRAVRSRNESSNMAKGKELCERVALNLNTDGEDKLNDLSDANVIIRDSNQSDVQTYCCPLCCEGSMAVKTKSEKWNDQDPASMAVKLNGELLTANSINYSNVLVQGHPVAVTQVINAEISEDSCNQWDEDSLIKTAEILQGSEEELANGLGLYSLSESGGNVFLYTSSTDSSISSYVCRLCSEIFESAELCLSHAKCHATEGLFPCSICPLCFSDEAMFINHCEEHKSNAKQLPRVLKLKTSKRLQCITCSRRFNNEKTLRNHSCVSGSRPYKCDECGKFFRSEARLEFHQQVQHHGGNPVVCEHCGKEFSRENNLFDHVRLVHRGEKAHICPQCGKTFQLKARLVAHMRVHSGERPFECELCGGKFYDNATLKGHRVTHMDVKPFQCDKCGRCFARKTLFKQHVAGHTEDDKPPPRVYACKLCPTTFPSHARLAEHRRDTHPDAVAVAADEEVDNPAPVMPSKPFKCEDCGKSFAYRVTLVAHRRNHTGELPFVCEFCQKRFSQKRSLVLHRRTHTGEKPYGCEVCGKRFVQSAHLYSHLRLHTGEKPYACQVCGDRFRLKDVRDAHQRKHTGERPFKCSVCEKAFRTSHSYYQHMWIHQGKKPYPCEFCGKAFRRSNGLKIHIRIHTGEKPHACDVCGRCFAQKQDMKKHRNLHITGKL